MLSVRVCVWMLTGGGTNRNRCTQRLAILHAQTYPVLVNPDRIGQSNLLYGPKSPAKKGHQ